MSFSLNGQRRLYRLIARVLVLSISIGLALSGSIVPATRTLAAAGDTYTVTGTDDSGGSCTGSSPTYTCTTLRDAVGEANSSDGGTIVFAPSLNGQTITLNSAIDIRTSLSITGPGSDNLTIEIGSQGGFRHVTIGNDGSLTVSLSGLTLTTSNSEMDGGGIHSRNTNLTLDDMVITNNRVVGSDGGGNGGGIYATDGTLTIHNSTISNNTADGGNGGGIYIEGGDQPGILVVRNSTINGNTADGGDGGGIYIGYATVSLLNSTISRNTANYSSDYGDGGGGGGIYLASFESLMQSYIAFSTITNNTADTSHDGSGGGISSGFGNEIYFWHTIVANQAQGADCTYLQGYDNPFFSDGYNMDSDNTCNLTETGDQPDTDPMLGPLQDNGGPTLTHALLAGSPAIDAGDPDANPPVFQAADVLYDQRGEGFPRVQDGDSDGTAVVNIGAYEEDEAPTVTSTQPADAATDVPVDATITVTFSEDVTVGTTWATLVCNRSGTHTTTVGGSGSTRTLDPSTNFAYGETCTVTVLAAGVRDSDNQDPPDTMIADYSFRFTTVADTNPPDTEIVFTGDIPNGGSTQTTTITIDFTGSDPEGNIDHYECRLDDGAFEVCEGPITYEGLEEGEHRFEVRAVDEQGNVDPTPAAFAWVIVSTPPVPVITSTASDPTSFKPIPITITFSNEVTDFTSSDLLIGNATASNFAGSGDTYTADLFPLSSGLISVEVGADVAYDTSGNGNLAAEPFTITYLGPKRLSLGISGPPATPPGGKLTYTLTYENTSDDTASKVRIVIILPEGVTPDLDASPPGWQCVGNMCTYTFTEDLAAHERGTLLLVVTVGNDVSQDTTLTAEGSIEGTFQGELQSTDPVRTSAVVGPHQVYVPLVLGGSQTTPTDKHLPDLVITSMSLAPGQSSYAAGEAVQFVVVVKNQGDAPTPHGFWVDVYINPAQEPTANTLWYDRDMCGMDPCFGVAWDVPSLAPGESATLVSVPASAAPAGTIGYANDYTMWHGWFANGNSDGSDFPTAIYGYVDSWGGDRNTNGVTESVETNNDARMPDITVTGENPEIPYPRIPVDVPNRPSQ